MANNFIAFFDVMNSDSEGKLINMDTKVKQNPFLKSHTFPLWTQYTVFLIIAGNFTEYLIFTMFFASIMEKFKQLLHTRYTQPYKVGIRIPYSSIRVIKM